jgi:hypothetical protein
LSGQPQGCHSRTGMLASEPRNSCRMAGHHRTRTVFSWCHCVLSSSDVPSTFLRGKNHRLQTPKSFSAFSPAGLVERAQRLVRVSRAFRLPCRTIPLVTGRCKQQDSKDQFTSTQVRGLTRASTLAMCSDTGEQYEERLGATSESPALLPPCI